MDILRALLGLIVFVGIAYLLSSDRKQINWRTVGIGIGLQVLFAFLIIMVPLVSTFFTHIANGFTQLLAFSDKGAEFVFGSWPGSVYLYDQKPDGELEIVRVGFIFAFKVLPTILFFSALSAALYYIGFLQLIVKGFAAVLTRTMKLSGIESLAAAANVFIGQTEAPLVVKPYLEKMSKSEIMCLMTGGMATIAGGVFGAYVGILGGGDTAEQTKFAAHLLSASIMSAPAAIVMAKILVPERPDVKVDRSLKISKEKIGSNLLDAISIGTKDGLKLAVNVGAMLLTFTALMYMVNGLLVWFGGITGINASIIANTAYQEGLTLQFLLGNVFAPFAWLMGVDVRDLTSVGQVLGEKTILNEFFAYFTLGGMKANGVFSNPDSVIIATYALCGFANFASIGIQIGGISAIAPGQQRNLASLGIKALIGGTIACFMTATIAGMIIKI